jgi:hypothetical protein
MGLKLQGILINQNFENDQEYLFELLSIPKYRLLKKGNLNNYWNGFEGKGNIVFSFFDSATIIRCDSHFISSDSIKKRLSHNNEILAFFQYDAISAIAFDYFKNGKNHRRLYTDVASEYYKFEEGDKLSMEGNSNDPESSFYNFTKYFLHYRIDSSYVHDPANSYEYKINFKYPNLFSKILGIQDYHPFWKKTF